MSEEVNEDRQEFHSYAFSISTAEEILSQHKPIEMDEIERRIESDPEPAIFKYYIRFQFWKPGPYLVCLFWLGILITGVLYGFKLLSLTVFSFSAPSGTDGYIADSKMDDLFKERINSRELLLYFKCNDCGPAPKNITNTTVLTTPIQWAPNMTHTLYTNASYDGWIMNEMGKQIREWGKEQGDIYLSYSDFYSLYFSYGITPNETGKINQDVIDDLIKYEGIYLNDTYGEPKNLLLAALSQEIFISKSFDSAIAILSYDNGKKQTEKNDFIDHLDDFCKSVSSDYGKGRIQVSMTGESALVKAMNEESRKDVERKDTLTIPLALCVLALIIRSWRLMFIPLLTFGVSICASFSIMHPFTSVLDVNPFCPSIMMSVTIAMSIDYSLFLLSRYREEVERATAGVHNLSKERMIEISRDAIRQTTRWSGKVIALSGCILSLTYFGLIFYPMEVLQSVGLGAGLAIVCTILVNLTLTPAILLIFPYFFSQFGWAGCPCQNMKCCKKGDQDSSCWKSMNEPLMVNEREDLDNNDIISRDVLDNSNQRDVIDMEDRVSNVYADSISQQYGDRSGVDLYAAVNKDDPCEKCWYHCGSKTTVCPWSILISVVVYAAIAPIGWQFTTFKQQLADTLIFPRDSEYYDTYNDVVADFSAGFIAPWFILIERKNGQPNITSTNYSEYMNETGLLIEDVFLNATGDGGYDLTIEGLGFIGSTNIGLSDESQGKAISKEIWDNEISCVAPWANSSAANTFNPIQCWNIQKLNINPVPQLLQASACYNCSQANGTYQFIQLGKISNDKSASYYQMTTAFDPYYEHAIDFVDDFRGYLSAACDKYGYECYLSGGSIDEVDSVKKIYDNFPMVLGCIVAFVFCLMGLVFKSVFVPFRLFITIAVPMTFVYGLAVMTYQHGMLSGLNIDAFANTDGLYWLIPVMTVTILIGLALDYDIFLFARIYEYRVMGGVPTHEAIIRGVYKTGSIITAAGIIMGIAFCGLLLSKITSLNQTGFIMVIAVLVDTFIIRTSLVPAVLSIAKEVNWWPGLNPKCKSQQDLINDMEIRMNSSKHINSNYSINGNAKPLKTGSFNENTLDETM